MKEQRRSWSELSKPVSISAQKGPSVCLRSPRSQLAATTTLDKTVPADQATPHVTPDGT